MKLSKKTALRAAVAFGLVVVSGAIIWRVLRPSEVVTPAIMPLPTASGTPKPGALGALISAPLIIDDRMRVFARKREVWADGPPSYHYEQSAFWSYRRWPGEVIGVAVIEGTPSVVISAWSDGALIAIHADTGNVIWRAETDPLGADFTGRRTGASTVYDRPGLFADGSTVVIAGPKTISGYLAEDGTKLWSVPQPVTEACQGSQLTSPHQLYLLDTCTGTLHSIDLASGQAAASTPFGSAITRVEPVSCTTGSTSCQGLRTHTATGAKGWLLSTPTPTESPALAADSSVLVQGKVITPALWSHAYPKPTRVIPSPTEDKIFLLTPTRELITLNASTGEELSRSSILLDEESHRPFEIGHIYVHGRYLVLERIKPDVPESSSDDAYYFSLRPVLIALS